MAKSKSAIEVIKPQIEIDEEIPLHKKGWVLQRIGWMLILGVMLCGAIGLFGEGWLSEKTVKTGAFSANYEKYFRYETEMKVRLESSGEHIGSVALPQDYLKHFRIVRFVPEPENNVTNGSDVIFNFLPGQNRLVTIYMIPRGRGNIQGEMKINGANNIGLKHFIYP